MVNKRYGTLLVYPEGETPTQTEAIELLAGLLEKYPNEQNLWNFLTDSMNREGKG
ncbi:MAG: hypothetical protein ACFFB7_05670 [Candidatus Sifarchaeia archaeon]